MTVMELIEVLLDLEEAGHGDCPIKVTTPRRLMDLEADEVRLCTDDTPAYVLLDVSWGASAMRCTTYEADALLRSHGIHSCYHCGCLEEAHHSDGSCYTVTESVYRWRFYQRTKRWPEPDEGCEEVTGEPDAE
jgi:hypothetical protein